MITIFHWMMILKKPHISCSILQSLVSLQVVRERKIGLMFSTFNSCGGLCHVFQQTHNGLWYVVSVNIWYGMDPNLSLSTRRSWTCVTHLVRNGSERWNHNGVQEHLENDDIWRYHTADKSVPAQSEAAEDVHEWWKSLKFETSVYCLICLPWRWGWAAQLSDVKSQVMHGRIMQPLFSTKLWYENTRAYICRVCRIQTV
jgi:hypothetical protein